MSWVDWDAVRDLWVQIGAAFARKTEAVGSLSWSSPNLSYRAVDGGNLGSVDMSDLATDNEAGHSLSINDRTITLHNVNGGSLGSVTVPATDTSDKANVSWVSDNCIGSAHADKTGNTVIITFYDLNGNFQDSVSFTV